MLLTTSAAVRLTTSIVGCAIALSSAELLVEFGRLADGDLLGWDVGRYHTKWTMRGWLGKIADLIFDVKHFRVLVVLRFVTGITMAVEATRGPVGGWILAAAFIETFLIAIRSVFGLDGAFQMNLVTLAGLWVNAVSPVGSAASWAGLWFITVQLGLSYAIAGLTKLGSVEWRNGLAVVGILGTSIYGDLGLFGVVNKRRTLAVVAAWSVMTFEASFAPMCAFGGRALMAAMLMGVLFHLSNAVFMGLNGFLVSFLAVYPVAWSLLASTR